MSAHADAAARIAAALNGSARPAEDDPDDLGASWRPVDLGPVLRGERPRIEPTVLRRSDGQALLYPGRTHVFAGESESAKTWLALLAVAQVLAAAGRVLFIDYEDDAAGIVGRLRALGVDPVAIDQRFVYVRPDERVELGEHELMVLMAAGADLAVIDGMTEALEVEGLSSNRDTEVARFQRLLPKRIAREAGCPVITIDHVTKNPETRGRFATGSQHKLAGVTGAQYLVEATKTWAEGKVGRSRLTIAKDRPGVVRSFAAGAKHLGDLVGTGHPDGGLHLEVVATAEPRKAKDGGHRPTVLMERVSRFLAAHEGEALSKTSVRAGVKGDDKAIDRAVDVLVLEKYVDRTTVGQSQLHRHVRPYVEALDGLVAEDETT